jgi:hypothetical protein
VSFFATMCLVLLLSSLNDRVAGDDAPSVVVMSPLPLDIFIFGKRNTDHCRSLLCIVGLWRVHNALLWFLLFLPMHVLASLSS